MYGYRYSDNEKINELLIKYTSEFDVIYIGLFKGKHVFSEFGKLYSLTEKKIAYELRKMEKEYGYKLIQE